MFDIFFPVLVVITAAVFSIGIWHGLKTKSSFYLSAIPFSVIVIVSAWIMKISENYMFLLSGLLVVVGVTLTIRNLIYFQKQWKNEQ